MPWNLRPTPDWPCSLCQVGISEWETGDELYITNPDLIDSVSFFIEVV